MRKKDPADSKYIIDTLEVNEKLLEGIYERAVEEGIHLKPDEAMQKLYDWWGTYLKNNPLPQEAEKAYRRSNDARLAQKLHHHAVDLYYKAYLGVGMGASKLSDKYLENILALSERRLSYGQIAKEIGLPTTPPSELTKSRDTIRSHVKIAKKRLRQPS